MNNDDPCNALTTLISKLEDTLCNFDNKLNAERQARIKLEATLRHYGYTPCTSTLYHSDLHTTEFVCPYCDGTLWRLAPPKASADDLIPF